MKKIKTTVEHHESLIAIDFAAWRKEGITCLLLDVDSTVTSWLGASVPLEIANKLQQARESGITHIGLVTNSNQKSIERIKEIARQCNADGFFMPKRFKERKPNPSLIRKAIDQFDVEPGKVAVVGDKYTADVIAAKRAEVAKVAWVDRLGKEDNIYDRLIRRPAEAPIKIMYRRKSK